MCNCCVCCRSLLDRLDDARVNFVISNRKVCKLTEVNKTVKTAKNTRYAILIDTVNLVDERVWR